MRRASDCRQRPLATRSQFFIGRLRGSSQVHTRCQLTQIVTQLATYMAPYVLNDERRLNLGHMAQYALGCDQWDVLQTSLWDEL